MLYYLLSMYTLQEIAEKQDFYTQDLLVYGNSIEGSI